MTFYCNDEKDSGIAYRLWRIRQVIPTHFVSFNQRKYNKTPCKGSAWSCRMKVFTTIRFRMSRSRRAGPLLLVEEKTAETAMDGVTYMYAGGVCAPKQNIF